MGFVGKRRVPYDIVYSLWQHKVLRDIDIDTEKGQRANILEKVKEKFGYDKVLNICTFKTEGTASAIQTMCRGMDISIEDASYLSSLVVEGKTIKQCLEDKDNDKDCSLLIKEMLKFDGLIENVMAIEGLCCGRSSHASGVYIFSKPYTEFNAMMKTPKGLMVTQYDMYSSDYQGGLKLDFLTIEALDRVRKTMDLMLTDGVMEWQGSLKTTYDKYLHPTNINMDSDIMFEKLRSGKVLDAFQYDSPQGKSAIAKIEPNTFLELMNGNALMRLTCKGEQPIDRYKKFKVNISLWYEEMRRVGLTNEEIRVMENHFKKSYGVASTQEDAMRLSMDNEIAGFDLVQANKLRKAIAKAKAKDMVADVHKLFVDSGVRLGNREVFLNYVWDSHIVPMLSYSFSEPHLCGYTMILMQELNLVKMSELHWLTGCLCVNAGDITEEISKGTDYGAIAKAIGNMDKGFVTNPYINTADVGFKPNMERNSAVFGLGAVNGISTDLAREIISLRPFKSIDDFIRRCVETRIVQTSKMVNLIKAGAFDEFNPSRVGVMIEFINYLVPNKEKLSTANIPKLISFGVIPVEYKEYVNMYLFRKEALDKKNCSMMINKSSGLFRVEQLVDKYKLRETIMTMTNAIDYDDSGDLCVNNKAFDKCYKAIQEPFFNWLGSKEALDLYNYCLKNEVWLKHCQGTEATWEMDSICYYTKNHELEEIGIKNYFEISNFFDLDTKPHSYTIKSPTTGRNQHRFSLSLIAGVVVDKNKTKSTITLSTLDGVVDIKLHKETFAKYDRRTETEKSWFQRGSILVVVGYRREGMFIPKTYRETTHTNSIIKIIKTPTGLNILENRGFEEELY